MPRPTTTKKTRKSASNENSHKNYNEQLKNMPDSIKITCFKPLELDYNEARKIIGTNNSKVAQMNPTGKIKIYPKLLPKKELERIKDTAKFVSVEKKLKQLQEADVEKKRMQQEYEKQKEIMRKRDEARFKAKIQKQISDDEKFVDDDDLDNCENDRKKTLNRAFLAKHENEEEIKKANQLILAAKCHVIREAQIMEKNELEKELKEEDLKLEKIMMEERDKALKEEEEKLMIQNKIKSKYVEEIKNQLQEREMRKLLLANKIEEEAKILSQAAAVLHEDDERKALEKKEKQAKLRKDLQKAAEHSLFFKKMEFEEQQQAELKILEYMRQKDERHQKFLLEKKLNKEAMERQQNRLIKEQQKTLKTKEEEIDIAIKREQERKEREFRRKEKENALRKKQTEKELAASRQAQIADLNKRRAIQMANNEADFRRIIENIKNSDAKEKEKEEKRLRDREKYREDIIKQINKRTLEKKEEMKNLQNEHLSWIEKERLREKNIQSVIQTKLDEMRNAKMPEKFIKDVEKQLQLAIKLN